MENLAHSASFQACEKDCTIKPWDQTPSSCNVFVVYSPEFTGNTTLTTEGCARYGAATSSMRVAKLWSSAGSRGAGRGCRGTAVHAVRRRVAAGRAPSPAARGARRPETLTASGLCTRARASDRSAA